MCAAAALARYIFIEAALILVNGDTSSAQLYMKEILRMQTTTAQELTIYIQRVFTDYYTRENTRRGVCVPFSDS